MSDKTLYDEDSIQSLTPREHVLKRPSMYIGTTDNPTQLAIEILSNSVDEFNVGHGDTIIFSNKDNIITVQDFAQAFPLAFKENGKSILEIAFGELNSSAKYDENGVYAGSGALGLHGQGAAISNFLSDWMIVSSIRDGKKETIYFENGIFQKREIEDCSEHSGTTVQFLPNKNVFSSIEVNLKKLFTLCDDMTCLCEGLTIIFNGKKLYHENGIVDLLEKQLNQTDVEIISNRFITDQKIDSQRMSCAITYVSNNKSVIVPYVNSGITDIGPHITTIKTTLTRIFNKWAREQGLLKEKDKNLDGTSLQEGLILVANIKANGVEYQAQIKSTVSKIDTSFISSILSSQLEIWLDNNPSDGKAIIEKALVARKAAEAARKAREKIKQQNNKIDKNKNLQLPTSLTDCWSKEREQCELLIAEGKSAATGLVAARNGEFQSIYGVRGKMLSVLKTAPVNIYKNQEINNLVQALGLPVNEETCKLTYQPEKLRYGKIIACADADPDGYAIENLLFNILWYMCPELILNGHVYSAIPPLFRVTTKKNEYIYLRDESALEQYKKEFSSTVQFINRMKGLGEMDSEELAETLLNPKTRNIVQLVVTDFEKTNNLFNSLYGRAVQPRVIYLQEHSEESHADYE